jgi:hypothetical protein
MTGNIRKKRPGRRLNGRKQSENHAGIAPVALRMKPRCIVVESIVLRLFKKLPKTRVFQQFFAIFAGI